LDVILVGDGLVGTRRGDDVQNFFRFLEVIVYPKRKKADDEEFGQFRLEGNVVKTGRASLQGVSEMRSLRQTTTISSILKFVHVLRASPVALAE
jgi:hypothetical protein